jgi:alpha-L-fucosidase
LQTSKTFDQYINDVSVPQVKEILSNYGDIAVLWWDTPTNMTDEAAQKLKDVLKLQPNIITNDRLKRPNFPGDTKTPEQKIPTQEQLDGKDWETCMTMNGSWGYKSWDHNWKSVTTLIRNLVDIASKGGNYLLNIGPKEDGSVPQESIDRLKAIGKWMKVNSGAIYGTHASPLHDLAWGRCTMKEENGHTTLNLFVFDWPADNQLLIPALSNEVLGATLIAGNKRLKARNENGNVVIELPKEAPDSIASLIQLDVQGKVVNVNIKVKKQMKSGALD